MTKLPEMMNWLLVAVAVFLNDLGSNPEKFLNFLLRIFHCVVLRLESRRSDVGERVTDTAEGAMLLRTSQAKGLR